MGAYSASGAFDVLRRDLADEREPARCLRFVPRERSRSEILADPPLPTLCEAPPWFELSSPPPTSWPTAIRTYFGSPRPQAKWPWWCSPRLPAGLSIAPVDEAMTPRSALCLRGAASKAAAAIAVGRPG